MNTDADVRHRRLGAARRRTTACVPEPVGDGQPDRALFAGSRCRRCADRHSGLHRTCLGTCDVDCRQCDRNMTRAATQLGLRAPLVAALLSERAPPPRDEPAAENRMVCRRKGEV